MTKQIQRFLTPNLLAAALLTIGVSSEHRVRKELKETNN